MGTLLGHLLDSPTLLVFDDVHWMDDASSELLRYLGTQLPTRPWLACTTRRPGEDGFAAATGTPPLPALTLRLEPLPEDDARALALAAAGDRRLTEEEVAALMERAAGNPLFLRELASVGEKADDAEDLPETVEALVATRIDQLAPGDRALLRWASVLGVSFSGSLIAEVLEDDSDVAAGSEAWDRLGEFVERDPDVPGAFRFRHALIRDAAYEGLSYRRRRELHGRVAEVIERQSGRATRGGRRAPLAALLQRRPLGRGVDVLAPRRQTSRARSTRTSTPRGSTSARSRRARRVEDARRRRARAAPGARSARPATRQATTAERSTALKAPLRLLKDDPVAQAELYEERAFAWAASRRVQRLRSAT